MRRSVFHQWSLTGWVVSALLLTSAAHAQDLPPLPVPGQPAPGGSGLPPLPVPGQKSPSPPASSAATADLPAPLPMLDEEKETDMKDIESLFKEDSVPELPPVKDTPKAADPLPPLESVIAAPVDAPKKSADAEKTDAAPEEPKKPDNKKKAEGELPPLNIPKPEEDDDFSLFSFEQPEPPKAEPTKEEAKPEDEEAVAEERETADEAPPEKKGKKGKKGKEKLAPEEEPDMRLHNYKSQILPSSVYRKSYNRENSHLPKAITYTDYHHQFFAAIIRNDQRAAHAFISNGIELEVRNAEGDTPLLLAIRYQRVMMVRMLVQAKANPDVLDARGMTPLHIAAYMGNADLVRALLEGKADTNLADERGITPLIYAITLKRMPMIDLLLQHGANPNLQAADGKSALHVAAAQGNAMLVDKLLDHGADVTLTDDKDYMARDYAYYYGHRGLIEKLSPPEPVSKPSTLEEQTSPYRQYYGQQPAPYYPSQPYYAPSAPYQPSAPYYAPPQPQYAPPQPQYAPPQPQYAPPPYYPPR